MRNLSHRFYLGGATMLNKPHFRITFIYLLISFIWIFFSDKFLFLTFKSSDFITKIQTFKGFLFVSFTGFLIFFLIKDYYEKSIEKNREIKFLAESKDFFLKNVSHELKTPLNGIFLINELLKESSTLNKSELISELGNCASELDYLVSNILEVAELQTQNLELINSSINISDFAKSLGMLHYFSARKKGVDLGFYIDPFIPTSIISDEKKLKKVVGNILANAVRFTSEGYVLFEILRGSSEYSIIFKISDTGKGFSNNSASNIFNSLFSNNFNSHKDISGVGSGLIIASQNANILGGKITFDSSLNKGSIFYFELPIQKSDTLINYNFSNNNISQKVVIISKYQANSLILKRILEDEGCSVYFHDSSSNITTIYGVGNIFIIDSDSSFSTLAYIKEFLSKDSSSRVIFLKEHFSKENSYDSLVLPLKKEDIIQAVFKRKISQKLTALVADDNELNRELLCSIIAKETKEVFSAKTGEDAFDLWNTNRPDIIFLDINLPLLSGYEIAKQIRESEDKLKRCCIVAVTAYKIDPTKLREHGFDLFIEKPFKFEEIYNIILQESKIKSN
jgi:signal transduction histidine kinase/CheY-like chemotaxis protein